MSELDLEAVEKIVQHTAKTITHGTAPETRALIQGLSDKIEERRQEDIKIIKMLEEQNNHSTTFSSKVDAHMQRVEPVIRAFEDSKRLSKDIENAGNRIAFWAKVITSIGIVALGIKYAIASLYIKF